MITSVTRGSVRRNRLISSYTSRSRSIRVKSGCELEAGPEVLLAAYWLAQAAFVHHPGPPAHADTTHSSLGFSTSIKKTTQLRFSRMTIACVQLTKTNEQNNNNLSRTSVYLYMTLVVKNKTKIDFAKNRKELCLTLGCVLSELSFMWADSKDPHLF